MINLVSGYDKLFPKKVAQRIMITRFEDPLQVL